MTEHNKFDGTLKSGGGTLKLNLGQNIKVDPLKSVNMECNKTQEIKRDNSSSEQRNWGPQSSSYNGFRNKNDDKKFGGGNYQKNDGRFNRSEEDARFDAVKNRNQTNVYTASNQSLSALLASKNNIIVDKENEQCDEKVNVKVQKDESSLRMSALIKDKANDMTKDFGLKIDSTGLAISATETSVEQKVVQAIKNGDKVVQIDGVREAKIEVAATHKDFKMIKSKDGEVVKEYVSTLNSNELLLKRANTEKMEEEEYERARVNALRENAALREKKKNENLRAGLLTISTDENDIQGDILNKPWIRKKSKPNRNFRKQKKQMIVQEVVIDDKISIKDLAVMMNIKALGVAKVLGKMEKKRFDESYILTSDLAELLVLEFGHIPIMKTAKTIDSLINKRTASSAHLRERPSVVTIMGHVDHGKTTLLDAFRKTNIVASESGGITQHIGAYQITTKSGKKISFIDTPGHEAFTAMRARGAQATDIVILVVAADDGVMPQTIESINHIKASGATMIVAINKIDKISGEPTKIMNQLLQYDVVVEQLGGEIMAIPISAKNKTNLDKLEDAILLQAEFMELKADYDIKACGLVIESKVNNAKGTCATLLIQHGTLHVGDCLITNDKFCKVRVMNDEWGKAVKLAEPAMSVEVFGFQDVPTLGQRFIVMTDEKEAKGTLEELVRVVERQQAIKTSEESGNINIFNILSSMQNEEEKELKFIIKADVAGTIDAVKYSLEKLNSDSLKIKVVHAATGTVTESDVSLAKTAGAIIAGFNINVQMEIMNLVSREKVILRSYKIIYQLIDDVKDMIENKLKPQEIEKYIGRSLVKQIFDIGGVGKIAGCLVIDSLITTQSFIRVKRKDKVIVEGIKIEVLKRLKEDVREVKQGLECAIGLKDHEDIKIGDVLEAYIIVENK